ncbi:hypothetical protein GQF61_04210 [Sphingobacterium sp. DK4209]|uniref:Phage tail tape measure protein n=1 Tax=Sphingobacterium zhuxiongii TaxID=2662364 RepID=A0A5Q0Q8E1_9SPHI|nr:MULTISPECIES: hypothetical protein [unclassified Sphingobacterium]MVZ65043.1 hypothetical protein [Sphingobacterium sp. DK4209]QGA25379.1 hypothetical protein GFH32_03160 [Sphingobacterium sp. dk4302]
MSFVATIEADINKWTPNLDKAGKDVSNFANRTKQDLDKVSKAQRGAGTVAMEFNRVIQDAPFGMMGISNNLTQLSDNYKTYANNVRQAALEQGKSISNFQIFKGAVAGVLSPINLFSLGLSAVTSGIILYQQWKQKANKATKESTDKFKELNDSLSNLSTTMYKAAQQSGAEVAQLGTLYKVTQDVAQSTGARKKAAKDLIDQYPALFGKFSQEQIMLGKAKTAYDEVSKSIIATARAQAAYGRIGEKASQQLAIDETNRSLQKEIALLDIAIQRQESLTTAGKSAGAVSESVEAGNVARLNNLFSERADILKQVSGNLLDRAKLQEDINQLEGFAATNQANTIALTEKQAKATKDLGKSYADLLNDIKGASLSEYDRKVFEIGVKYEGIFKQIQKIGDASRKADAFGLATQNRQFELLNAQAERFLGTTKNLQLSGLSGLSNSAITIPAQIKFDADVSVLNEKLNSVRSTMAGIVLDVQSLVGNGISDMMSALGNTIAEGGNWMEGIGKGLLKGLAGLSKSIGEQMIAFGVAGLALKKLMLNPMLAIAAGAALVALGSIASASVGRQTSNFNGTNTGSYGSNITSSPSSVPRGAYYNNDRQEVTLRIKNGDLVGSFDYSQQKKSKLS